MTDRAEKMDHPYIVSKADYCGGSPVIKGTKFPVRSVVKITDKNHHTFEWYENRGGQDMKTLEINYTRKK